MFYDVPLTPEVRAIMGNAREIMVRIVAWKYLTGMPWSGIAMFGKADHREVLTVWEWELGERLANQLRPGWRKIRGGKPVKTLEAAAIPEKEA
jgi:hypothetical protein